MLLSVLNLAPNIAYAKLDIRCGISRMVFLTLTRNFGIDIEIWHCNVDALTIPLT